MSYGSSRPEPSDATHSAYQISDQTQAPAGGSPDAAEPQSPPASVAKADGGIKVPFSRVPSWLAHHPRVSDRAYRLFGVLASYADYRNGTCYPSRARLAVDLHCAATTVDRAVRSLIAAGAVQVRRRHTPAGGWTSNFYTLIFDGPPPPKVPRLSYREYLQTDGWRATRIRQLQIAHGRCRVCNGADQLDVHHRTYVRLGKERDSDLIVLCRGCHDVFHRERKLAPAPQEPAS